MADLIGHPHSSVSLPSTALVYARYKTRKMEDVVAMLFIELPFPIYEATEKPL